MEGARAIDSRRRWVLTVVSLASVLVILAIQMPSVVLPEIGEDLGASFAELQWVVNAYALTLAALLLAAGSLSDRLGRKRVFIWGLGVFLASSLLCALAWSPPVLDLARAAQGVGGATLFAGSLAILGTEFQGPARGRALGLWGAAVAAGIAAPPLVGGALGTALGWRAIFFFCFVLTLPAVATLAIASRTHGGT